MVPGSSFIHPGFSWAFGIHALSTGNFAGSSVGDRCFISYKEASLDFLLKSGYAFWLFFGVFIDIGERRRSPAGDRDAASIQGRITAVGGLGMTW